MALQLGEAVGADREGELPVRRRRRQRGTEVVGESFAAVTVRPRYLLGLVDADENAGTVTAGCGA
jgi:hypothetical protein